MASTSHHHAGVRLRASSKELEPHCDFAVKVILLGDVGVGKTTFLHTFLHRHPPCRQGAGSRLGQTGGHRIVGFDGQKVKVTLWDTGGQERYRSLTQSYYRGAHACIIIYDTNNRQSFDNVIHWLESIEDYDTWTGGAVTVLVGMGREDKPPHHITAPVNCQRVRNLASHYHLPHFEQVDCYKDPHVLDDVMDTVVTLVMSKAMGNGHMLHSLRPHTTLLRRLHSTRLHPSRLHSAREQCCICPEHCGV